jgi:hypothetical protein
LYEQGKKRPQERADHCGSDTEPSLPVSRTDLLRDKPALPFMFCKPPMRLGWLKSSLPLGKFSVSESGQLASVEALKLFAVPRPDSCAILGTHVPDHIIFCHKYDLPCMSSLNNRRATRIPAISEKELRQAVQEGLAALAAEEPIIGCAKVVWNDPYQLKYAPPFGAAKVIRVNLIALTDAGAMEEAEAILEQRHPGVEWIIT